jgi:hypothetical protein
MRTDLTKHERDELARRKLKWQGVYVYRLNRLIQEPGWLDLIDARHNALNGLRFALEIDPVLDDFLSLDVKKSSIRLPDQITEIIRPVIEEYEKSEQVKSDKARTRRNNQATPESLLEITSKRIAEVSKQSGIPSFEPLTASLVVVTNVSGKHEHRVKPLPVDGPSDMSVDWVDDLDGGLLWETHYGPNHDVRIRVNRSHDFYQKIILLAADNPIIFNGFLEILWAFSRAEFDSARGDKTQFAEMRRFMSLTLSLAAENVEELELDPVE